VTWPAGDPVARIGVVVDTPLHAGMHPVLDYECEQALAPGTLVRVPLGARVVPGIVWPEAARGATEGESTAPERGLKRVAAVLNALPPLDERWCELLGFAAGYYQRSMGELALAMLPPELRKLDDVALARRLKRLDKAEAASGWGGADDDAGEDDAPARAPPSAPAGAVEAPALTAEQAQALAAVEAQLVPGDSGAAPAPMLLFGSTGSGKTEVYLRAAEAVLERGGQVLVLVPEINLTPQLQARFAARFPRRRLIAQHSALTPAQRLRQWLLAHTGRADLVLGTRLAVFASMPRLALIVVDEEHDASFKQQEGARYSARDLAVWRARQLRIPVLLGSATPSLETWAHAEAGRYVRLAMPTRIGGGALPEVRLVDMGLLPRVPEGEERVLAPSLVAALQERLARGEQSLLLLNRRGFAPVLHCAACGWKSGCPHCSAWRVFHKGERTLRCHHCGFTEPVPRACPDCGNLDIHGIGRGTEKLQEQLAALLPAARVARIDADSVRGSGSLEEQLGAVHEGEVDILVGTQMVAKGHDFRRVTLVGAVNPDGALFSSDFRASERLFALLMQAAGRAGRDAAQAARSQMWVQTWHPQHALYAALKAHDFERFARQQLAERRQAGLPPYVHLALLRAEGKTRAAAADFLADARAHLPAELGTVRCWAPVPPAMARVADVERMQMLQESPSRPALQRVLAAWMAMLPKLRQRHKALLRFAVDVDPQAI
jgi:primosomal protein N' (replication factor Y)